MMCLCFEGEYFIFNLKCNLDLHFSYVWFSSVSHLKDHFQQILCMVIDLRFHVLKINFQ